MALILSAIFAALALTGFFGWAWACLFLAAICVAVFVVVHTH